MRSLVHAHTTNGGKGKLGIERELLSPCVSRDACAVTHWLVCTPRGHHVTELSRNITLEHHSRSLFGTVGDFPSRVNYPRGKVIHSQQCQTDYASDARGCFTLDFSALLKAGKTGN